jgi:predicted nucleic acid-binding protein
VASKAYIETSVIGYLCSRPTRDELTNAHQKLTREWWERRRSLFELYVSELVVDEVARGNAAEARVRLSVVGALPILKVSDQAKQLAAAILRSAALPAKAGADATHIAIATVNAMDFLLTWNCTHIANGIILRRVTALCRNMGYDPPIVCTPEELMEG